MHRLTRPQKLIYDMEKFAGGSIATVCGSIVIEGNKEISKITNAVNDIYRINDALRIRITEIDGVPYQYVTEYQKQDIDVLRFKSKAELDSYAEKYAREPMDFYGSLCDIKAVILGGEYGILMKLHHIISDAWTLTLLGSQFAQIMDGKMPKAYSYLDYINEEDIYLSSKRYHKDREYYVEQFKKCDEVTYISDKQVTSYEAARKTFVIDADKTAKLTQYAEKHNTSLFMLLMTALGVYINRIKMNEEKFYVGTAVLNRSGLKEQNTAGMFINTVPFLFEFENENTFAENLENVANASMSIFRHQRFNYGDILKTLRSEFNFSGNLYDVMLSYQNAKITGAKNNFETTWYSCGMQTESLQIHIDDRDSEGILKIHYDYQTEKFTENEIEKMHEHIFNLLFDAIGNDNKKIYELEIFSQTERNTLLYKFNDTKADYPKDKCVHQLFEEQVLKTPDKTAVIACDRTLTYAKLNEEANKIAYSLIDCGVKTGDIVAVMLPRNSHLIPALFGVLKIGAAYMPIDPDYPKERINYLLKESAAKFCIDNSNIYELISNDYNKNLNISVNCNNMFCALHTSGSTGIPKLALLKQYSILNFLYSNLVFFNNVKTVISVTIITFDAFIQDSILPLALGKEVLLASNEQIYNQTEFEKMFDITDNILLFSTPTKLEKYITQSKNGNFLTKIQTLIVGGEVFSEQLYNLISQKIKLNKLYNGYGPTETTMGVTYADVTEKKEIIYNIYGPTETTICVLVDKIENHNLTIGKPISNTQIYILDKYGSPVPIGQTGELCIAGDCVGAGYLNRPELTAEKFVDNPFGEGKMYKTGDLAYWREDGNIAYVGRNDFQVKIRGLRIELGEIENAICSVEGVSQAVVVVRKDETGRQLICAFYTEKESVDLSDIKAAISAKLPKYMMPHIFTVLDEMPLTPSGKISRKVLPEVDLSSITSNAEYIAPITDKEKVLVGKIENVLNAEKVGILDNFFDLGGDSLKAIELISKLETAGYKVTVKTIFDCDTIKDLADRLEKNTVKYELTEIVGNIPATDAQMRVYTAQSMQETATLYNVPYCFTTENLDVLRFENAVNELIKRHESLRTRFENKNGQIIQIVEESASIKIKKLKSGNILDFMRPFDLSKAPLIRVGYYENTVMIDIHHIITDGSSMPVFFYELNELYMGRTVDNNVLQYKDIALQGQKYIESEKYWLSVFSDEVPVLEINTDFPRGQKQTHHGNAYYDFVDIKLHNKIKDKCKELGITPFAFYMGGFNILLSKFSGNEDIVVGMPVSGRNAQNLNTIGMFVNTVALRNKPVGTKTVSEFLSEVKENSINAIANQDYPFGRLIRKLNIEVSNRNPLFDIMFAYQSEEMTDVVFGDKKAELLPISVITAKYDITFNVMPRENEVVLMAEYCTDLYKENTIKRMVTGYKQILSAMLNKDDFIKDISAVSQDEMNTLLYKFNDTKANYPKDKCIHQLFEEQVAKTPDKTAVIACDKTLTYDELNKLSNRIAHGLIAKGVKPNDIVAFALPRNSYLIPVMFGILKSGAAYMPIDPDYPQDRIDYMLEDSKAKEFITKNNINEFISDNEENPSAKISSDNYCYCIYTSGTTGKPKGTLIRHRNLVNFCNNKISNNYQHYVNAFGTRLISIYKCSFDAFGVDYALFLLNGLSLVLASDEEITNSERLAELIKKYDVDAIQSTPSTIKALCANNNYINAIVNAKIIMVAAENFTPDLYIFLHNISSAKIFNGYGPSETTIGVSFGEINSTDIHIGKPNANTQFYILDKYEKSMPIGQTGELCIAGDCVGAGYLNRPKLTAEKFVDNPFGEGKMYKTGDLAYWREDGNIAYVGRNDFQVKIRGLRIELGEIENAICSVNGVSQAVVVVRKDETGRQLICAFYTEKENVNLSDIKATISAKLPKYMMPHIFTVLEEMPLTPSGKISRKALPDVNLMNIANDTEYVKPQTELQKGIASVMEKVLNYTPIGLYNDFFDLGGDSLKAIEFVSKAHSEGIYFNLQAVFDCPTVGKLCEYIESGDKQEVVYDKSDFYEIHKAISCNILSDKYDICETEVGNMLLTGATGYLGIHILADFLRNDSGKAYCIVRGDSQEDSQKRLKKLLDFYFGNEFETVMGNRIIILKGDLLIDKFGLAENEYNMLCGDVNTVIHAAASVKHYGSYKYFYDMNVASTKRVIEFAKKADANLIHTSTLSVSGNTMGDNFDGFVSETEKHFYESSLYIEQPLDNVYARSKFEAEKAVIEAMADGVKANICRMGNLTNRYSDGKFQYNYETNAFAQRVKALLELGKLPEYMMKLYVEFTPINDAAGAVMAIARHFNTKYNVFHVNSHKVVYFDKLLAYFAKLGIDMKIIGGKEFAEILRETAKQTNTEYIFETFINDMDEDEMLNYDSNIRIENDYTVDYLKQIGFEWSDIGLEYLRKYIRYFRNLGYLEV